MVRSNRYHLPLVTQKQECLFIAIKMESRGGAQWHAIQVLNICRQKELRCLDLVLFTGSFHGCSLHGLVSGLVLDTGATDKKMKPSPDS